MPEMMYTQWIIIICNYYRDVRRWYTHTRDTLLSSLRSTAMNLIMTNRQNNVRNMYTHHLHMLCISSRWKSQKSAKEKKLQGNKKKLLSDVLSKKWDFNEKKIHLHLRLDPTFSLTTNVASFTNTPEILLQQDLMIPACSLAAARKKNASALRITVQSHYILIRAFSAADPYFFFCIYIPNVYISAHFFLPAQGRCTTRAALAFIFFPVFFFFIILLLPNFVSFKQLLSFI